MPASAVHLFFTPRAALRYVRRDLNIDDWIDPAPPTEAKPYAGKAAPAAAIHPPVHSAVYVH